MLQLQSAFGVFALLMIAWSCGENRGAVSFRQVAVGLMVTFVTAVVLLKLPVVAQWFGVFMPAGVPKDAIDYYVELLKKVRATPEWKQLMTDGAFNQTTMSGADYAKWVGTEEQRHRDLMKEAGFLATN